MDVGLGELALNTAPIFGGALLAAAVGQLRGPDYRAQISQDMDLLDRLPAEATARRAELQRTIDARVDDLIDASDQNRALRRALTSYHGNWRDVVLLISALMFVYVWWHVNHDRANWLPAFIALILLAAVAAGYTARGLVGVARSLLRRPRTKPPGLASVSSPSATTVSPDTIVST